MSGARPLSSLLRDAGFAFEADASEGTVVSGLSLDSRRICPGELFCALRGRTADGNAFVADAVGRGAAAVLSDGERPPELPDRVAWIRVTDARRATGLLAREWHGRPDESLTLVGVTGTNGKTTVAYFVEAMTIAAGRSAGRIGTVGVAWGGVERGSERTTPEAPEFYALLDAMRRDGVEIVVSEVSSHALALDRVTGARFRVSAFLNLGRDHLDFHGTIEAYFEAKLRLFEAMGDDDTAVLPAGDPWTPRIAERVRGAVVSYGRDPGAQVRLVDARPGPAGSRGALETPKGRIEIETELIGSFQLDNVAAAAACGLAVGLPPEAIASGVRKLTVVPGRLEPVSEGQPFAVLVDYAHTAAAMTRMLGSVRELAPGRVLVVFGCGGGRDRGKRPEMGRAAAAGADLLFLTSDNPRDEDPLDILAEIEAGAASVPGGSDRCRVVPDRVEAVHAAIGAAGPGDVVVVAGKGHETTQTVRDRALPLDDRVVARRALEKMGWHGGRRAGA